MFNFLPDDNSDKSPHIIFINMILWILVVLYKLVSVQLNIQGTADIIEKIISIISNLMPLISTLFLYIINQKAINAFFRKIKHNLNKKKDS